MKFSSNYGISGRILICMLFAIATLGFSKPAEAVLDSAISGAWFDPSHDGEGFLIEFNTETRAVVYWFTYDDSGNQRWFVGLAEVAGSTLLVNELLTTSGPAFGADYDPAKLEYESVGKATFTFGDCQSGVVDFEVDGRSGSQTLTRITAITGLDCDQRSSSDVLLNGLSGNWYLHARNGEGLIVEWLSADSALVFWFTYRLDGTQAWYFGVGTLNDSAMSVPLLVTSGGEFGDDFDPADVNKVPWGTLELSISCEQINYNYESLDSEINADSGHWVQLSQIPATRCIDSADIAASLAQNALGQLNARHGVSTVSLAASSTMLGLQWQDTAGAPESTQAAFMAGTVGQLPTAIVIHQLALENKLSLSDKAGNILDPALIDQLHSFQGIDYSADITIKQLLAHESGLPGLSTLLEDSSPVLERIFTKPTEIIQPLELLELVRGNFSADFRPGQDVLPSELGYVLLGLIIESVTGQDLPEVLRQRVFDPLGMSQTWLLLRETIPPGVSLVPQQLGDIELNELPALAGLGWAGAALGITTTDALALATGMEKLLPPEAVSAIFAPGQRLFGLINVGAGGFSRGNDCQLPDSAMQLSIDGGAFLLRLPNRQLNLVGFTNQLDQFGMTTANRMLNSIYGDGDCFDTGSWATLDSSDAGYSNSVLEELDTFLASTDAAAYMVVDKGKVVHSYGQVGRRYQSHSTRKSILSGMIGILHDAGKINLNSTLEQLDINDSVQPLTSSERSATVQHLLQARSGIYLPAVAQDETLPPRGSATPGSAYFYNNWDFNALGTIFEKLAGETIYSAFDSMLAQPLGMDDYRVDDQSYISNRTRSDHAAYFFSISARDMARFGQLFLNNGSWNDQQVISKNWITESTTSYSDTGLSTASGFAYMWWTTDDGYMAIGSGGQRLRVLPDEELVVVLRVDTYNEGYRVTGEEFEQALSLLRAAKSAGPD